MTQIINFPGGLAVKQDAITGIGPLTVIAGRPWSGIFSATGNGNYEYYAYFTLYFDGTHTTVTVTTKEESPAFDQKLRDKHEADGKKVREQYLKSIWP